MPVIVYEELHNVDGWEEIEQYANERMEEEELNHYQVFIRPQTLEEIEKVALEYGEIANVFPQEALEYLEDFMGLFSSGWDGNIIEIAVPLPEKLKEELTILYGEESRVVKKFDELILSKASFPPEKEDFVESAIIEQLYAIVEIQYGLSDEDDAED